ncbi:hypothetical protein [Frigidibacter sp. MR17.24]|uniref:hypothetical protein n=1 Tax=Frigidibacter sp. MR17.24 TaxID=3127345 RepID=UPI003012EFED
MLIVVLNLPTLVTIPWLSDTRAGWSMLAVQFALTLAGSCLAAVNNVRFRDLQHIAPPTLPARAPPGLQLPFLATRSETCRR